MNAHLDEVICSSKLTHIIIIMKKSQLINSSVFLLILTLSFSVSWGALSSILDLTSSSEDFVTCLQSNSYNSTAISQLIFTPNNASFLPIWGARVNNIRFNKTSTPKPSVIVTPNDENQIRTTLFCSKKHGYEMRIRCGGHDFEGLSSTADVPFVMLDLSNKRTVDVDVESATAWVQAGTVLGEVYYAISQKTDKLYFPAGICPTVGTGGYLGGAGYGNLQRKYGTGGDNVLDVRFMDVNGRILNRKSMGEDLFWALRGGGASSFGIVLAWKLNLVEVPERVTVFLQNMTLEQGVGEVLYKYQFVTPTTDRGLSIRTQMSSEYIGNTTQKTVRVLFFGLYQGTMDTLLSLLNETFPELNVTKDNCEEVRMVQASLVFGGFTSNTSTAILASRNAIQELNSKNKIDYVRTPMPRSGLKKLFEKMFENDGSEAVIFHPYGGKMDDISETAIPFPHRAGVLYHISAMVRFDDQASDTTPVSLKRINWLQNYNEFLTPYVSKNPREAYINYNDLDMGVGSDTFEEASVWGDRYWKRDNFERLIRIKAKVDPTNFFKHPQSIPVFIKSVSDM